MSEIQIGSDTKIWIDDIPVKVLGSINHGLRDRPVLIPTYEYWGRLLIELRENDYKRHAIKPSAKWWSHTF